MQIDEGEQVVLTATFRDDAGALVDPATPVEVAVKDPTGSRDVSTAQKVSTGTFEYNLIAEKSGVYNFRFESADKGVEGDNFFVEIDRTK